MANKVMVFKMPVEADEKLSLIAEQEERTKAWLLRKAIQKFLEAKENATRTRK